MSDTVKPSPLFESLSALVDDEASELELRRILHESEREPEVRARWQRYQIASAVIRKEFVNVGVGDLSAAVRTEIAGLKFDEAESIGDAAVTAVDAEKKSAGRWQTTVGRFAIAASVAGLVLVGGQQMNLVAFNGNGPTPNNLPSAQLAGNQSATTTSSIPTTVVPFSSQSVPVSAQVGPVPVQAVSDSDVFTYQERPRPQVRYMMTDQRKRQYDQSVIEYFNELMLEHAEHAAQNSSSSLLPYARVPVEVER